MMARSDFPQSKREQARVMFALGKSAREVARTVGMSPTTACRIRDELEQQPDFVELREQCKQEFIRQAWEVVGLATQQAKKTIKRAGPGEAAKVAGIFYDKIALASGEATGRHEVTGAGGGPVTIRFEGELDEWSK